MGRTDEQTEPWGIISAKAQDVAHELPMQPITMCALATLRAKPAPARAQAQCPPCAAPPQDENRAGRRGGRLRSAARARKVHGVRRLLEQARADQVSARTRGSRLHASARWALEVT